MTVWSGTTPEFGKWTASTGAWSSPFAGMQVTYVDWSSGNYGGVRFDGVAVPRGVTILSATLTITGSYNTGVPFVSLFALDDAPALATGQQSTTRTSPEVQASATSSSVLTVTGLGPQVQQVIDRAGWSAGNALAFFFRAATTAGNMETRQLAVFTLEVEYQEPVQYLTPARVAASARTLGPLVITSAVTTAGAVRAFARTLRPDVVAPVSLAASTVTALAAAVPPAVTGTGDAPPLHVTGPVTATGRVLLPTLARTVPPDPPPVPWERLIEDPAYYEALAARDRRVSSRAEIISPDGAVVARLGGPDPTHPGALSGAVTCDGGASIRWTCDLVLDNPDLLPSGPYDLLSPFSFNRIRLWWSIRLRDGRLGEIPVGTYYPDLTPVSDDGARVGIVIHGSSAVAEVKRARWDRALDLSGMTISEAIVAILTDRAPWAQIAVTPTTTRVPKSYEPGAPGEDPWEDVEALADAAGMVAYDDRMGVIRVDPRPVPGPPQALFVEGPGTSLVELSSVATDKDWVVNKVTVASASPEVDPPVTGVAVDDDPASPLGRAYLDGHLYSRRVENAIVTTRAQAETMARNILADRAPVTTASAVVHPAPHLDPGMTVSLGRARAGLGGSFTLTSWSLDIAADDLMSITATTRREY